MTSPILPPTLAELVQSYSLSEALEHCAAALRKKPDTLDQHMLRFELFCLKGEWERAGKQMETCARLDASLIPHMAINQALIHCEEEREAVFAGAKMPQIPASDQAGQSEWPVLLARALRAEAQGQREEADTLRSQALDMAPECPGQAQRLDTPLSFAWITDSDTRIGPVLEAFCQDHYVWLPFDSIRQVEVGPPATLRDFIWQPAKIHLDSSLLHAFLPARYPESGQAEDVLALGRETRWRDVGRTGVFGLGQKVWCTDAGDLPVCDVRALTLSATNLQS